MTSRPELATKRRLPVGAEVQPTGTHFRVWAPDHRDVAVVIEDTGAGVVDEWPLADEGQGYFSAFIEGVRAGALYRIRPGAGADAVADPASRFQPMGPHAASQVVDAGAFAWTDANWPGITIDRQVLYEFHVGTFTAEGTWRAAIRELPALVDLGITTLEMMPIADFSGQHGWGYDGVNLFAPSRLYGNPDDLRTFIDTAHRLGLGVILDVVYNHVGPRGNYLARFTSRYFSTRYQNEWGEAINFDDEADAVREFMIANAAYWIDEFHFDGLRLDATQQIYDASPQHIIEELTAAARAAAAPRSIIVVAENEPQDTRLVRTREDGGFGLDALWNDDFHHNAIVALTGRREAYYTDYGGTPQEFLSMAKWGFLYQGQRYSWQKGRRGTPSLDLSPRRFITFLENHDQVANGPSGRGGRLRQHSQPSLYRAITAFWLLSPGVPMFFQGQEFGSERPFLYFADHEGELGQAVRMGRAEFMTQFRSPATRDLVASLPHPGELETFTACRLGARETSAHGETLALHRDLLRLRRDDPQFNGDAGLRYDGAVLSPQAFVMRWLSSPTRLLVVNLGADLHLDPAPEPLLAPPLGKRWDVLWSSEDPSYGGLGTAPLDTDVNWRIPGFSAIVLHPIRP